MKKLFAVFFTTAALTAPALADGFSGTLVAGSQGGLFSIAGGLNYSVEVAPNLFLGGSLNPVVAFTNPTAFGLNARLGGKYVLLVTKSASTNVNAYVGAGTNISFAAQPIAVSADINAGLDGWNTIATGVKLYGGLDGNLSYGFTSNTFGYDIAAYGGVFFEPIRNLEARLQGSVGYGGVFNGAGGLRWNAESSLYYTFVPEAKVGVNVGYGSSGFSVGLGFLFAQKPGSLGIAGNYLP
jgi:hypothetical protein